MKQKPNSPRTGKATDRQCESRHEIEDLLRDRKVANGHDPDYEIADFSTVDVPLMLFAYSSLYQLGCELNDTRKGLDGAAGTLCSEAFDLIRIATYDFLRLPEECYVIAFDAHEINASGSNAAQVLDQVALEIAMVQDQVSSANDDPNSEDNGERFVCLLAEVNRKIRNAIWQLSKPA